MGWLFVSGTRFPKHQKSRNNKCAFGELNERGVRVLKRYRPVIVIASVVFLLVCWGLLMDDYEVPLIDEYRYFCSSEGIVIELNPEKSDKSLARIERVSERYLLPPRVGPNVDGYCVYPGVITGHVAKPNERPEANLSISEFEPVPGSGYFVIDTRGDRFYKDLTKQEWTKRLRALGIKQKPRLFRPSRLDEYLGRNKPSSVK